MKKTKIIMGMPITIEVVGEKSGGSIENLFKYFHSIDDRFSTYKNTSEISRINAGLPRSYWSQEMKTVIELCDQTKQLTKGYFDISHLGKLDPSGLVKGWAVNNAAQMLIKNGFASFYIEAGGDIQVSGLNAGNQPWVIGIRNPFNTSEIVKVLRLSNQGMATSGTYIRGQHIYNPHKRGHEITDINSLTVIGSNVYEADRYATAAFAMGASGIGFIERSPGLEGYMIDSNKKATFTSGFESYAVANV